jgi:molecular chaperone DnaK (HSP70)
MILKYVKTEAEKFAKITIKDVVLVLPNYWSIHQRNFLLQAAAIADIYVLSIVS